MIVDETVNDWVKQLLNEQSSFGLDIEPEKLKGGILGGQAFKFTGHESLPLELILSILGL